MASAPALPCGRQTTRIGWSVTDPIGTTAPPIWTPGPAVAMTDPISPGRVGAGEQVAQGPSPAQGEPDPPAVLGPVVQQVAPLAEALTLRCRRPQWAGSWSRCAAASTTLVVRIGAASAGAGEGTSRPRPSRQVCSCSSHQRPSPRWRTSLAMRPATGLAAALGTHEPDPVADLRPVDGVVPAQLRLDRHGRVPAQASRAAVLARGRWR